LTPLPEPVQGGGPGCDRRCYLVLTISLRTMKFVLLLLVLVVSAEHCMPWYFPVPEMQAEAK